MSKYIQQYIGSFKAINVFGITEEDNIELLNIEELDNYNNEHIIITSTEFCGGAKKGNKYKVAYSAQINLYDNEKKHYTEVENKEFVLDGLYELTSVDSSINNTIDYNAIVTYRFQKVEG